VVVESSVVAHRYLSQHSEHSFSESTHFEAIVVSAQVSRMGLSWETAYSGYNYQVFSEPSVVPYFDTNIRCFECFRYYCCDIRNQMTVVSVVVQH
jgi:hypothetical protein